MRDAREVTVGIDELGRFTNHRGERLDLYGKTTVYEGNAHEERYLVWYGTRRGGSFRGVRETFQKLRLAIREAKRWERRGYDTKVTDRLVSAEKAVTEHGGQPAAPGIESRRALG